jgi:hypothetical protein
MRLVGFGQFANLSAPPLTRRFGFLVTESTREIIKGAP